MNKSNHYFKTLNGKKVDLMSLKSKYQESPTEMVSYLISYTKISKEEAENVVMEYFKTVKRRDVSEELSLNILSNKKLNFILKLSKITIITSLILTIIILFISYLAYDLNGMSDRFIPDIVNLFNTKLIGFVYYFKAILIIGIVIIVLFVFLLLLGLYFMHKPEIRAQVEEKVKSNNHAIDMFMDKVKKTKSIDDLLDKK